MVWSFVYLALRRSLESVLLYFRSAQAKEIEILVLRHELAVLRRQRNFGTALLPSVAGTTGAPGDTRSPGIGLAELV